MKGKKSQPTNQHWIGTPYKASILCFEQLNPSTFLHHWLLF